MISTPPPAITSQVLRDLNCDGRNCRYCRAADALDAKDKRIVELETFAIESTSLRMDLARELSDLKMTEYDEDCRGKPPQSYEEALEKFKALLNRLNGDP